MGLKADSLPTDWEDHPGNPVLSPPFPEPLIADPTFVAPGEAPDGRWHLFAHGLLLGIHHFASGDGVRWRRVGRVARGLRPFVVRDCGLYRLFFERFTSPLRTVIACTRSPDLRRWDRPKVALEPSLPWEGRVVRTNGNPCAVRFGDGWLLYYSAGLSWLADCGFPEPRHVGVARAATLDGPWEKHPDPVLSPSPAVPHRNLGAGAIKVVPDPASDDARLLGFNNGIYTDSEGRSRSDIRLLVSPDGVAWTEAHDRPLVAPEGTGWKRALVYALDVRRVGDGWRMYYNARDGWRWGRERIGLATCRDRRA
jgi:predicted GH43/DUF377 family glycosyl hydrolase